jgi:hypothetical protein
MLVAYFTTDDVNLSLAVELAARQGMNLQPLEPRDGAAADNFDALLYDWDYWPSGRRSKALAELLAAPAGRPVALHGYSLGEEETEALCRRGVAVHRRLRLQVFQHLRQAVIAARVAEANGQDPKRLPGQGAQGAA